MLRHVLESLVENDPVKARMVRAADAEVDAIHREMFEQIEVAIQDNPADTGRLISLLGVSRQLERAADHAVNIAEDVVYMSTGEMIRHNKDDLFLTSGEDNPEDAAGDDVELGIG